MKALDIDSWRNLSKDKMIRFAAMMPDTDKEVALKVIEQFPEFKTFALEALDVMQRQHESSLVHNKHSQDHVHRAYQEIREILKGELDKDHLSADERRFIYDLLMETANREFAKDSENKRLIDTMFGKALVGGVAATAGAVVFIGGKVMLDLRVRAQRGWRDDPSLLDRLGP
jgi:hypothetical protein